MNSPLIVLIVFILGLILLDLLALRFGADSQARGSDRKNWW
jgi:hypothetical protein